MKKGIDFFPMNCQQTEPMELIEAQYGIKGFATVVKVYQRIYANEGYYCDWNDDISMLLSRQIGLNCNLVSDIIHTAIKRDIFSKFMYDKCKILTSTWIQETYFFAVKRRKEISLNPEYLLVDYTQFFKNADISDENVCTSKKNADISEQSKVKDSKVKDSTVKETEKKKATTSVVEEAEPTKEQADRTPYKQILDLYHDICKSYPKVVKMTTKREKAIKARLNGGYTLEDFKKLFETAEQSSFLKGSNDRGWKADFDWLICESGMTKTLEGKYSNKKPVQVQAQSGDFGDELEREYGI